MNLETASAVTNPPPEMPPSPGQPRNKPGLLRRWLGLWRDRDLDLEGRDTSDWNIYYYFYRQVAQHGAVIKLKHMKWIALLYQLYFFGMLALVAVRVLILTAKWRNAEVKGEKIGSLLFDASSMVGASANIYLMPLLLFVPVIMVCPAFRLRNKTQGFMTSRAKEPPLLAHLVQYTSNTGLVTGVLQSMLFTWRRFVLLLLPAIFVALLELAGFIALDRSPKAFTMALGLPFGGVLFISALSMFITMQPFCYRLDSLLVMVAVAIETFALFTSGIASTFSSGNELSFLSIVSVFFIPSCLFACVYFPLAALDTGEYGLGKRFSKWIRILLFSLAGVLLLLLIASAVPSSSDTTTWAYREMMDFTCRVLLYGLVLSVCGLLVSSVSMTSLRADRLRMSRANAPFRLKLFDPASPASLLPVFALEIIIFIIVTDLNSFLSFGAFTADNWSRTARVFWSVMHFSLVFTFWRQHRDPKRKDPWNSHVLFNMTSIVLLVLSFLLLALVGPAAKAVSGILYIASIVLYLVFFACLMKNTAPAIQGGVPADGSVSAPAQAQNTESL